MTTSARPRPKAKARAKRRQQLAPRRRPPLTEWQKHRQHVLVDLDLQPIDLSRALGEPRSSGVSAVLLGKFRSRDNLEPRICEVLGVDRGFMGWPAELDGLEPEEGPPSALNAPAEYRETLAEARRVTALLPRA